MSITTTNTATNNTISDTKANIVNLGLAENYVLLEDEPGKCVMVNDTTDIDKPEAITFQTQSVKGVAGYGTPVCPSTTGRFMQASIKISDIFSSFNTDSSAEVTDGRVDDQLTMSLSFKYPLSGYVKSDVLEQMLSRLLGALYKADGTTRFNDLLRGAVKPREL